MALLPFARSNAGVVEARGHLFVFGGNNDKGASTSAWEYDPVANSWRDLPAMPTARLGHGAALVGDKVMVFGGMSDDHTYLDSIDAFDLHTRSWTTSPAAMPARMARFALVPAAGRLWFIGGSSPQGRLDSVWSYGADGHWTQHAAMPEALDRLAAAADGEGIYVFGGEGKDGKARKTIYRYDVKGDGWKRMRDLGVPRKNLAAARLGDRILVLGGWDIVDDAHQYITWVEAYDPSKNELKVAGALETPRDGCRAVAWAGRVVVVGGFNGDYVADIENVHWATKSAEWHIDPSLKLTLGWMASGALDAGPAPVRPQPLGSTPADQPDVTDVSLDGRGKVSLKFYQYPDSADHEASARRILSPLLLTDTALGDGLQTFLQNRDSVVVEKAVSETVRPFPPFEVPSAPMAALTPQQFVDDHVVFSTLYVHGVEPAHTAKDSLKPLEACRQDLMALFQRAYRQMAGPEPAKYAYFADDAELDTLADEAQVAVMRLPLAVTAYDDWQARPVPQHGADKVTGALTLHRDVYTLRGGKPWTLNLAAIETVAPAHRSETLDIGAVYGTHPAP